MPGISPACDMSRKQIRHKPNFRYTDRARPHRRHRVYARTPNFGLRACFWINAFFAIRGSSYLAVATEWEAERGEQRAALIVGAAGRHDRDVHAAHRVDLVVVDLGEDELLGDAERVVAAAVE